MPYIGFLLIENVLLQLREEIRNCDMKQILISSDMII